MKSNWKKNIIVFMTSQAVSLFGSSLVQYAITWHITLETQSGIYATIAIICGFVPTFLLSPFAGVWADRYNRKLLIVLADGFIALSTLVLALVFLSGYKPIWLLFVVLGIRAVGSAVQNPCINAMLPDLVPSEHLTRVNGINGSVMSLITLASPMLSGVLLGFTSLENIFFIDVVTAVLAIVIVLSLLHVPYTPRAKTGEKQDYFGELKQGLAYVGSHRYLRNFFVYCAIYFFMFSPVAFLTPLQVTRVFGDDVWRLTALEVCFSVGMLVGGLAIAAWGGFKNRIYTLGASCVAMGVFTVILGFPFLFYPYLAIMLLFGLMMPAMNTPAMVLLQEQVEPAYIGRVFGVMTMISSSAMPLGMLLFGPLADVIPIEWLLRVTGVVMLLTSVFLMRDKALLEAGGRAPVQREVQPEN